MPWYSGAVKKKLPESDTQNKIKATQIILHSAANDNHMHGTYEYFRNGTNLESHFGVFQAPDPGGKDGEIWQFMDTAVRGDANYKANERPDGTGAISIETDSSSVDSKIVPWSPKVVDALVDLCVWLCKTHDIPARLCRNPNDPGIGWHVMFGAPGPWTPARGKICPGGVRPEQVETVIIPRAAAKLAGKPDPGKDVNPLAGLTQNEATMIGKATAEAILSGVTEGRTDTVRMDLAYLANAAGRRDKDMPKIAAALEAQNELMKKQNELLQALVNKNPQ